MKSAMQELIEYIVTTIGNPNRQSHIIDKAQSLLEKEKQQIIDAYIDGKSNEQSGTLDEINMTGKYYYNQTFEQ